jgi:hypothetical protein
MDVLFRRQFSLSQSSSFLIPDLHKYCHVYNLSVEDIMVVIVW